jgi:hypothetical protein
VTGWTTEACLRNVGGVVATDRVAALDLSRRCA